MARAGTPAGAATALDISSDSDDLPGVLHGLAHSVRGIPALAMGPGAVPGAYRAAVEQPTRGRVEEFVLDGGDGESGMLRVALAPGRTLRDDERELLRDLADQGARAARVVCLATALTNARRALVESREQESRDFVGTCTMTWARSWPGLPCNSALCEGARLTPGWPRRAFSDSRQKHGPPSSEPGTSAGISGPRRSTSWAWPARWSNPGRRWACG